MSAFLESLLDPSDLPPTDRPKTVMALILGKDRSMTSEDHWLVAGHLTSDHAASSYGQPVFVPDPISVAQGAKAAYGMGEIIITDQA